MTRRLCIKHLQITKIVSIRLFLKQYLTILSVLHWLQLYNKNLSTNLLHLCNIPSYSMAFQVFKARETFIIFTLIVVSFFKMQCMQKPKKQEIFLSALFKSLLDLQIGLVTKLFYFSYLPIYFFFTNNKPCLDVSYVLAD